MPNWIEGSIKVRGPKEIEIHDGNVIIDKDMVYDTWTMPLPWTGG